MSTAVVAGYARTPFHPAKRGELAGTRPDDLVAGVIRALLTRAGIDPGDVEDVLVGCAFPEGEQGLNVARLASLMAGVPNTAGAATVNRFCGSSMQSVHSAAGAVAIGAGEVFICAGVESMTRVPMMGFNPLPNPKLAAEMPTAYMGMGETAENVARRWQITRSEQEEFAVESHRRAAAAQTSGRLSDEIVPVSTKRGAVSQDGCVRADTTAAALAELKPAFSADGSVTAGTSSPLTARRQCS